MPRYIITLPDETIDHDGTVEISGGALELKAKQQLTEAFGVGEWKHVGAEGKVSTREPIPASNNATRVLFEGDDLKALTTLAKLWKTDPQTAAVAAVTEALEAAQAASAVKAQTEAELKSTAELEAVNGRLA